MEDRNVIVVGAGLAGLVAAYRLKKQGVDVVVLEASARPGGRMITDTVDGYRIDGGAQFLSSAYTILPELIDELGLASEYVETSKSVGIVRDGKIRKFRYDNPFTLLFGGLLNFKEWLSLGLGGFKLLKQTKKLPLNNYAAWQAFDDEVTEAWSDRYYGSAITDYFIEPLLEAFYFQAPGDTSRALPIAINAFGAHKARTMTLVGGIGKLPERLAENVDVRLGTPVRKVTPDGDKITVHTDTQTFRADHVILATPAPVSGKIHNSPNKHEKELLATDYSSTATIALALKNRLPKELGLNDVYGIWIPRKERKVIAAFTIETAKDPGRAKSGELVHVMLSGEAGKAMLEQDNETIIATVLTELEQYIPGISDNIVWRKVYRWPNAEPMSPVGRSRKIYDYRTSITKNNRIVLAGDYVGMPFTEGAAETGAWAATVVLSSVP